MAIHIEDYDVGDDSPVADSAPQLSATGAALTTISADIMTSGHIHEGNARVWAQTFDPRWVDEDATADNAALRPGDVWVNADYVAWQAGEITDPPELRVYDGVAWQAIGEAASTTDSLSYTHVQTSAAATWTVTHNLGYRPNVTVVDTADTQIIPGMTYLDVNTVELSFTGATAGKAYCS